MRLPISDPVIRGIARQWDLPPIVPSDNTYLDLLENIISQQLSGKVARTIFTRFCGLFPDSNPEPALVLNAPLASLREVGLSGAKCQYIKDAAIFAAENMDFFRCMSRYSDDEITEHLIQIKGVGEWTVQMLLIFSLNRPDVFPLNDLAIRNGMKELYKLNMGGKALNRELQIISDQWCPYRTLGTRYIWLFANNTKTKAERY